MWSDHCPTPLGVALGLGMRRGEETYFGSSVGMPTPSRTPRRGAPTPSAHMPRCWSCTGRQALAGCPERRRRATSTFASSIPRWHVAIELFGLVSELRVLRFRRHGVLPRQAVNGALGAPHVAWEGGGGAAAPAACKSVLEVARSEGRSLTTLGALGGAYRAVATASELELCRQTDTVCGLGGSRVAPPRMGWENVAAIDYRPVPLEVRIANRLARCLERTAAALRLASDATEGGTEGRAASGQRPLARDNRGGYGGRRPPRNAKPGPRRGPRTPRDAARAGAPSTRSPAISFWLKSTA